MARITLERLLEKIRENASDTRSNTYCGDSHPVIDGNIYIDLGIRGETYRKHSVSLPASEAFLVFAVKTGMVRDEEMLKKVRAIYEDYIRRQNRDFLYRVNHESAVPELIRLARVVRHRELEEELYKEEFERLMSPGGYDFVEAGGFAEVFGRKRDAQKAYSKAVEISCNKEDSVLVGLSGVVRDLKVVNYERFADYALQIGNTILFRAIYNHQIKNETKRCKNYANRYKKPHQFSGCMRLCEEAKEKARKAGNNQLADYFRKKSEKYGSLYRNVTKGK
jgi:hypothetical protein